MSSDREELGLLIDPNALEIDAYPWPLNAADRVLASDWLASVRREAAAEALEAASSAHFPPPGGPYPQGVIRDWLRARAAELREGKN